PMIPCAETAMVGPSMASDALAATTTGRLPVGGLLPTRAPSAQYRVSRATNHTANRMNAGITSTTRRLLAHGWSGVIAGRSRVVITVQVNSIAGSNHCGERRRARRHITIAAPRDAKRMVPSPTYQPTQYRLWS